MYLLESVPETYLAITLCMRTELICMEMIPQSQTLKLDAVLGPNMYISCVAEANLFLFQV